MLSRKLALSIKPMKSCALSPPMRQIVSSSSQLRKGGLRRVGSSCWVRECLINDPWPLRQGRKNQRAIDILQKIKEDIPLPNTIEGIASLTPAEPRASEGFKKRQKKRSCSRRKGLQESAVCPRSQMIPLGTRCHRCRTAGVLRPLGFNLCQTNSTGCLQLIRSKIGTSPQIVIVCCQLPRSHQRMW